LLGNINSFLYAVDIQGDIKSQCTCKAGFPLRPYRIVTYRSIFFCVEVISSTLVQSGNKEIRYVSVRLKWKTSLKPVFHFDRIVAKRSVFLCFLTTREELMTSTQKKMLRYVTIRLKWKTGFTATAIIFVRHNITHAYIQRSVIHTLKLICCSKNELCPQTQGKYP
jgi:hypothetical protein